MNGLFLMETVRSPREDSADHESARNPVLRSNAAARESAAPNAAPNADRFRMMVDQYFAFIWRSLRGLGVPQGAVDDSAQHVFWIASQKIETIAPGSERAFLFSTALGVAANARRARMRNREIATTETLDRYVDSSPNAEKMLQMKEERARLDEVLESMPNDLRTVFVLYALEGMTTPEISELLAIAPGTAASRLRRAREAFHQIAKRIQAACGSRFEK
jgi:RNA polymerase sigma-70 factor (ECF subfamily)